MFICHQLTGRGKVEEVLGHSGECVIRTEREMTLLACLLPLEKTKEVNFLLFHRALEEGEIK